MKVLKGDIIFTKSMQNFEVHEQSYLVEDEGKVVGVFASLPDTYAAAQVFDFGHALIIPGFVDLHFHAPQLVNVGLGLDEELLVWLKKYTFPEEAKYSDLRYAKQMYAGVARALLANGTTRAVVFSTIHQEATTLLMDILDAAGLGAYVGKVNMDRNSPAYYIEETAQSLQSTEEWVLKTKDKYERVKPIITPRFVPSCSEPLMKGLSDIAMRYSLKIQSHLSENQDEVEWVKQLHPAAATYAEVYDRMGLLGQGTIMAHNIYCAGDEIHLLKERGVFAVHCPNANFNLSSGIMNVRCFLNAGIKVALGTDVGAGHEVAMFKVMNKAIQASKIQWLMNEKTPEHRYLSTSEAFYLGTKAGGEFFGKTGSFEHGYECDALVIDDSSLGVCDKLSLPERLQKFIYCGDDRNIIKRFIAGKEVALAP